MVVVGDASTKAQALGLAEKRRPDVTLVDIYLGAESGLESRTRCPRPPRQSS
jgi:DNA-binding NarL/FixJ family response regulator